MKLECSIRIEDHVYPQHSFKRFINCNLYIGVMKKSKDRSPQLHIRTLSNSYQYKIVNNIERVRGVKRKPNPIGAATICFVQPKHYLMINCDNDKLANLLKLLHKFSDPKNFTLNDVPVMTETKKPKSKPKETNTPSLARLGSVTNISQASVFKQFPRLWAAMDSNLQKLDLNDVKQIKFPVILGQLSLVYISLTNMELRNSDLLWLNELQVRRSLKTMCLSNNQLTEFPLALIDCLSLDTLDLRRNKIRFLPHSICRLQKLRILNLAFNRLSYLPADITRLKLQSIDLSYNALYSNLPIKSRENRNFKGELQLQDWAALNVDPSLRFKLTAKDCPNYLLQKLRSLSRCVCGRVTLRRTNNQYYVRLNGIRFSETSWVEPQSGCNVEVPSVYLQYHFCTYQNRCEDKKFRMISSPENSFGFVHLHCNGGGV